MEYRYNNFTKTLTIYSENGKTEQFTGAKALELYKQIIDEDEKI